MGRKKKTEVAEVIEEVKEVKEAIQETPVEDNIKAADITEHKSKTSHVLTRAEFIAKRRELAEKKIQRRVEKKQKFYSMRKRKDI